MGKTDASYQANFSLCFITVFSLLVENVVKVIYLRQECGLFISFFFFTWWEAERK